MDAELANTLTHVSQPEGWVNNKWQEIDGYREAHPVGATGWSPLQI